MSDIGIKKALIGRRFVRHQLSMRGMKSPTSAVLLIKAERINTVTSSLIWPTKTEFELPRSVLRSASIALVSFIPSAAIERKTTVNTPVFANPFTVS